MLITYILASTPGTPLDNIRSSTIKTTTTETYDILRAYIYQH